ncbi:MAG: AAA family ATPase [Terrisporobacter sp.]
MASFYIEKIIASGNNKEDAIITLTRGLNIIYGRSDTGKSCILKSIYFLFGGNKPPFDAKATGYSSLKIIISTPNGKVTLQRFIGKNQILVCSDEYNLHNKKYDTKNKKDNKNSLIDSLLLKLIGIDDEPMVVCNKDFSKRRLTWKSFMKILYLNEDDICTSKSVLELMEKPAQTPFLSAILYLLTGHSFSNIDERDNKKIKVARKKAVETYINEQLSTITKRKATIDDKLKSFTDVNIEEEIEKLIGSLATADKEIVIATNRSKDLLSDLLELREKESECELSYSHYQSLKSQHIADIQRLTFIVDGESNMQNIPKNTRCPFCEGEMEIKDKESYIESSRGELARILPLLEGLLESEQDILTEIEKFKKEIEFIENEKSDIEYLINNKLEPGAKELTNAIEEYSSFLELKKELSVINDFAETWTSNLNELPVEDENLVEYRPREYFDDNFKTTIDKYAYDILEKIKYENLTSAHLNLTDFDLEINNVKKSISHGKGVTASINVSLALAFRKYFANNSKFNPGLLLIDSPLLGLDQGVEDSAPESMKRGLFEYFMDNQSEGQMIIIENSNNLPDLDYEKSGANVIEFTKGKSPGRYGFLDIVR